MTYVIERTSDWDFSETNKPCINAYIGQVEHIDSRNLKSPEAFDKKADELGWKHWFEEGFNHRIENGRIVRNLEPTKVWLIDINTLEELQKLADEVGHNIIFGQHCIFNEKMPMIEIYDDWR